MLNVKIVCVGTLKEAFLKDAVKEYEKRLSSYCRLTTHELKNDSALLPAINDKSYKIALCVEGKQMSSTEFAEFLEDAAIKGNGNITMIIGGADGLPEEVKVICAYRLSFSKMTFPHRLMRVILLEQLYRALNISSGGKYHH